VKDALSPPNTKVFGMITSNGQSRYGGMIDSLIAALASRDGLKRHEARMRLVKCGHECVGELIPMLKHPRQQVRWEAAKALAMIADRAAATALADALTDTDGDVRWVAAEGLITLGDCSIWPVLRLLMSEAGSEQVREAAHHVLHAFNDGRSAASLAPVLAALRGPSPETAVPVEAYRALPQVPRFDTDDGGHGC
jgi:hypothetical protein